MTKILAVVSVVLGLVACGSNSGSSVSPEVGTQKPGAQCPQGSEYDVKLQECAEVKYGAGDY